MRTTFTTLLTAACFACGAAGTMAVETNRQGQPSLRTVFDYTGPTYQSSVVPSGALSTMPVADAGYTSYVTDEAAADTAKTDSAACGCGNTCGCGDGCSCGHGSLGSGNCLSCDCCLGDAWVLRDCLTPCCNKGPTYGGWLEVGYYNHNERLSFDQSDGLAFRDFPHHLNLDQAWVYVERKAEANGCCADYGYRFDMMYGVDAQFAQSYGNPRALDGPNLGAWDASFDNGPYGWAMPQAYVEVAKGDWSWKIGRWFTPVGYEVIPATGNFFYSHTLTHFNSEPFGHTGALGAYTANDCMTWYTGWALGWDTGFEQFDGGNVFVGGFTRKMNEDVTFTYMTTVGNLGWRSGGEFGFTHHVVLVNNLSKCWTWVLQHDFVHTDGTLADDDFQNEDYGVTNYLIYKLNDCWSAGGRFEWWKSNNVTGESDSFQNVTGGLNYHAHANLVVRPEVRYDFTNEGAGTGDDYNQVMFGIDAVFTF